jgi:Ca2+-binding EF-hand superfamily protein
MWNQILDECDIDGDQQISQQEFIDLLAQRISGPNQELKLF